MTRWETGMTVKEREWGGRGRNDRGINLGPLANHLISIIQCYMFPASRQYQCLRQVPTVFLKGMAPSWDRSLCFRKTKSLGKRGERDCQGLER